MTNDSSDSEADDIIENSSKVSNVRIDMKQTNESIQPLINLEFVLGNYDDSIMSALDGDGDGDGDDRANNIATKDGGKRIHHKVMDSDEDL